MSAVELELLELAYELRPVRVAVLRSLGRVPGADVPLERGVEALLPRWLARALERLGYVEVLSREPGPHDLSRLRFAHRNRDQPPALEDLFFVAARRGLEDAERRAREGADYALASAVERARRDLYEVFRLRLAAVLRAVQLGGVSAVAGRLALEERVLAQALARLVEEWRRRFVGG